MNTVEALTSSVSRLKDNLAKAERDLAEVISLQEEVPELAACMNKHYVNSDTGSIIHVVGRGCRDRARAMTVRYKLTDEFDHDTLGSYSFCTPEISVEHLAECTEVTEDEWTHITAGIREIEEDRRLQKESSDNKLMKEAHDRIGVLIASYDKIK